MKNSVFEKICHDLNLGVLKNIPNQITGGLMHKMYKLETTKGSYALKLLNPQVMMRPNAYENYINAELIAKKMQDVNIPALPALEINGKILQSIETNYYMIFPWIDGEILQFEKINGNICEIIGKLLANMHNVDLLDTLVNNDDIYEETDWGKYVSLSQREQMIYAKLLSFNEQNLLKWNTQAGVYWEGTDKKVISHRDLDIKNILWESGKPIIIDWESAGYINPIQELLDVALAWSGYEEQKIDKDLFMGIINSYFNIKPKLQYNWNAVLWQLCMEKLKWLEYNLKRSLNIEDADLNEQALAINEVHKSLISLKYYTNKIDEIAVWLE